MYLCGKLLLTTTVLDIYILISVWQAITNNYQIYLTDVWQAITKNYPIDFKMCNLLSVLNLKKVSAINVLVW